jgi:hypothetical protein
MDYFHESRLAMQASWTAQAMARNNQGGYYGNPGQQAFGAPYAPPYGSMENQSRSRNHCDEDVYDDYGYDL